MFCSIQQDDVVPSSAIFKMLKEYMRYCAKYPLFVAMKERSEMDEHRQVLKICKIYSYPWTLKKRVVTPEFLKSKM